MYKKLQLDFINTMLIRSKEAYSAGEFRNEYKLYIVINFLFLFI